MTNKLLIRTETTQPSSARQQRAPRILVVGIIGLFAGKRIFEKNNPLPDKTLNALEENLSWIANRRN